MCKNYLRISLLLYFSLTVFISAKSQEIQLKVTDGILYTVDGKWGDGILLHYSKTKYGMNYKANLKIALGVHTLEYYFMKDNKVYEITFTAKADKKYLVYNEDDKPTIKENKTILTDVSIVNVSSTSSDDGCQIVSGKTESTQVAILQWDSDNDYFPKYKKPIFNLRKIDKYWGNGSTGYISGNYNGIKKDAFKVIIPPGEHTLSAQLEFGSYYLLAIKELTCNFEAGKTYTIVFDNFGVNTKKSISELQIKLILGSAKIVEMKD